MKKSRRMNSLLKLAKNREQDAVSLLNRTRQELDEREGQLKELQQFQRDYINRLGSLGSNGADMSKINEYRHFISQLSGAITMQGQLLAESRKELALKSQSWREARIDSRVIGNYQDRCRNQEHQVLLKCEQKEADEKAQQMKSR